MRIDIVESDGTPKMIGTLKEGVFRKRVRGKIHLYKKLDAWGIDAEKFTDVILGQATEIRVLDEDTNNLYVVSVDTFSKKGSYLHFKPHRAQIFLPRRYWTKTKYKKKV